MRFNTLIKKAPIGNSVLLISMTYVLYLGFTNQLNLYIHPRYILFTIMLCGIGLLVTVLNILLTHKTNNHNNERIISVLPVMFILCIALILPASTLSTATVTKRRSEAGQAVNTSGTFGENLFSGSTKGFGIQDWSQLLSTSQSATYYLQKPAKISGFIYDAGLGDNTVWVARFILTCCAVDAQPIGVPVEIKNWKSLYEEDEWVEIEGVFIQANDDAIVLMPSAISKINQPDNPYAN